MRIKIDVESLKIIQSWYRIFVQGRDISFKESLRNVDTKPSKMPLEYHGNSFFLLNEADCIRLIKESLENKIIHLKSLNELILPHGKFGIFYPMISLSDGAAESDSKGFFDEHNQPPWDSWIQVVSSKATQDFGIVFWTPPEFIEIANVGINVNPECSIRWLDCNEIYIV